MAYCTNAEVLSEFYSLTYASDTANGVTSAEVDTWITQADAKINSYISNKYTTPVTTGTEALAILKEISLCFVTARVKRKLKLGGGAKKTTQLDEATALEKKAMDMLKAINKGEMVLTDAPSGGGGAGTNSYGKKVGLEPTFEKGVDKW